MKYHFKVHKEKEGGFWAVCMELNGCYTQGETKEELLKNMSEALNLHLSEPQDSNIIFPSPQKKISGRNVYEVEVDPSVAIANRIREIRLKSKLTQVAMMEKLGIKNLSNYQRLEDPKRANPEWKTLVKIKNAFPRFHLDDLVD
ncbi:type II toxin-antitoxin system HicB family antitoxin [Bdellovibrio sp. 22V]|uniref:type II toxin-antitoxin system HicB family antitoxin n=1 Tax=Bdellovibrio TaxID=958 RepID=UPI0025430A87|nr:type II toxin-antitoxin system HicB family antitoxin [Bdellovibrio sp. 22V]WII73863.1 type II toxin-antitoxin system HicB family antitoxin [Bdellovibrio sp. 22V]